MKIAVRRIEPALVFEPLWDVTECRSGDHRAGWQTQASGLAAGTNFRSFSHQ